MSWGELRLGQQPSWTRTLPKAPQDLCCMLRRPSDMRPDPGQQPNISHVCPLAVCQPCHSLQDLASLQSMRRPEEHYSNIQADLCCPP